MSHLAVLCQKASDSAQPWRNECGIQLPLGVGTRERACKCSLALHVCGLARGGEGEQGEGGAGAPLHLLLHGSWDCVRAPAVGEGSLYRSQGFGSGVLAGGQLTYLVAFRRSAAHLPAAPGMEPGSAMPAARCSIPPAQAL